MTSPFTPGLPCGVITAKGPRVRSHRVGRATQADGALTTAYRAAVELVCSQCAQPIAPGQLFSRRSQHVRGFSMGQLQGDVCTACRPLRLEGGACSATDASAPRDEGCYG